MPTLMDITNHDEDEGEQEQDHDDPFYKKQENNWVTVIGGVVGKELFDAIQFIACKEDEMYGSDWQLEVCDRVGVCEKYQKLFWKNKGMQEARKALNRRRQNTTNSMKKQFLGKGWRRR
jgi:hypothetical protein